MQFFRDLGAAIEQRWRGENYNDEVFPDIAVQSLQEANAVERVDPWETIYWLFHSTDIPNQRDVPGRFGDPPITLYDGPRFYIDVYYWLDGTTAIHQHAFCGAFQVLAGSSIHSCYKFDVRRRINQHFLAGETSLNHVELLDRGAIRPIHPGSAYIHSLFHLDRPSATICVRTQHTETGSPQFDYRKPYFAVDSFFSEPVSTKRVQSAALLLGARRQEAVPMIESLLQECDFQTAFGILEVARNHFASTNLDHAFRLTTNEEQFQKLAKAAQLRHGELVDMTMKVFDETMRQNNLIRRRSQITHPDHRFFLALLLNVPDRLRLLDIVRQRFPDAGPVETVLSWIEELAATKVWGGKEPNVLGIENLDDDYLFVLQCLIEGVPTTQIRHAFVEEFSAEYAEALGPKPDKLVRAICESMLFKSIFAEIRPQ